MYTAEIRQKLDMIEDYVYAKIAEDEGFPERFCMVQDLIYEGDYYLRCNKCKFNFTKETGPRSLGFHCNRPWQCT